MNYNNLKDRYDDTNIAFDHWHADFLHNSHIQSTLSNLNLLARECSRQDFTGEINHLLECLIQYDHKTNLIAQEIRRHLTIPDPYQRRKEVLSNVKLIFRTFAWEHQFKE